jgi:hypothetical protein
MTYQFIRLTGIPLLSIISWTGAAIWSKTDFGPSGHTKLVSLIFCSLLYVGFRGLSLLAIYIAYLHLHLSFHVCACFITIFTVYFAVIFLQQSRASDVYITVVFITSPGRGFRLAPSKGHNRVSPLHLTETDPFSKILWRVWSNAVVVRQSQVRHTYRC